MKRHDDTDMGGPGASFQTTHWTQIMSARTLDSSRRQAALGEFCRRYWRPVYCYLRRKGHSNDAAKDLAQGFFCEVVFERELVQQADPLRGRLRALMLTALDNFVRSARRSEKAGKRTPNKGIVSLEAVGPESVCEPFVNATPDDAFHHAWASALLDEILAQVKSQCLAKGMGNHWEVFSATVLRPILDGTNPPSLAELCERLGVCDERTASNMVVTVKRIFQRVTRQRIRPSVGSDVEVEGEILDLMEILSGSTAR